LPKLIAAAAQNQKYDQSGQHENGGQRNFKFQINYRDVFPDNHSIDVYSTHEGIVHRKLLTYSQSQPAAKSLRLEPWRVGCGQEKGRDAGEWVVFNCAPNQALLRRGRKLL
jgi:hypothetical protein